MSALHFKKIDDEQSEVWWDGLKPHLVSTKAILLCVGQLCSPEVSKRFADTYPAIGGETTLDDPNAASVGTNLEVPNKG